MAVSEMASRKVNADSAEGKALAGLKKAGAFYSGKGSGTADAQEQRGAVRRGATTKALRPMNNQTTSTSTKTNSLPKKATTRAPYPTIRKTAESRGIDILRNAGMSPRQAVGKPFDNSIAKALAWKANKPSTRGQGNKTGGGGRPAQTIESVFLSAIRGEAAKFKASKKKK